MATTENNPWSYSYQEEAYKWEECYICAYEGYRVHMVEREGAWWCERCAALPPYSEKLYNAILALQRLFRFYYEKKAKPCASCGKSSLHLEDFRTDMGPICSFCMDQELDDMREEEAKCDYCNMDPCRCHDTGPCEDCGNPYECVCLEQAESAALKRHRRVCGDARCDGTCGTLDCGCIDVCRRHCEDDW